MTITSSIDAMFKRKRGRPPKNRVIEVINTFFVSFFRRDQSTTKHLLNTVFKQNKYALHKTQFTILSPRGQIIFVCVEKCRN